MTNKLFIITSLLAFQLGISSAALGAGEIPIQSVTVFKDRASVIRKRAMKFNAGALSIEFSGLTPKVDMESFKVHVGDHSNLTILGIRTRQEFLARSNNRELEILKKRLEKIENEIGDVQREVGLLVRNNENMKAAANHYKESFMMNMHAHSSRSSGFGSFVNYLAGESTKLNGFWQKLYQRYQIAQKERQALQSKISEIQGPKDYHTIAVVVDLIVSRNQDSWIDLQYLVREAGWAPTYDIYVEPSKHVAVLEQNAMVSQRTGENWDNVKLTLSNAREEMRPQPPSIDQYRLTFREVKKVQTGITSVQTDVGALQTSSADDDDVLEGGIERNFEVVGLRRIQSGPIQSKVPIAKKEMVYQEHLELVAAQYRHVFRKADLVNPFNWSLATGTMNVFYSGGFQQQVQLEQVPLKGHFAVNTGVEHDIRVSRSKEDKTLDPALLSRKQQFSRTYDIYLENFNAEQRTVKVLEQVPISEIDGVTVTHEGVGFQKDPNSESWHYRQVELKSRKGELVRLSIKIEAPKDFRFSWSALDVTEGMRRPNRH